MKEKKSIDLRILSLFPSPLGVINLGENMRELNKEIIKDIDNEMLMSSTIGGEKRSFSGIEGTWQSEVSPGMETKYQSFDILKDIIWQAASPVMINVGYQKEYVQECFQITNLWANLIWKRGGWSHPHTHGDGHVVFTGVYYPISPNSHNLNLDNFEFEKHILAQNKNYEGGTLVIRDPAKTTKIIRGDDRFLSLYPYYGINTVVIPRESLLVLFPSWLEHYVEPLIDEKFKRYSISFSIGKR